MAHDVSPFNPTNNFRDMIFMTNYFDEFEPVFDPAHLESQAANGLANGDAQDLAVFEDLEMDSAFAFENDDLDYFYDLAQTKKVEKERSSAAAADGAVEEAGIRNPASASAGRNKDDTKPKEQND